MAKILTQQEKTAMVMSNDKLRDLYFLAINDRGISYSRLLGHKIGKKRVGIQKLILAQKSIAASIYDNNQ